MQKWRNYRHFRTLRPLSAVATVAAAGVSAAHVVSVGRMGSHGGVRNGRGVSFDAGYDVVDEIVAERALFGEREGDEGSDDSDAGEGLSVNGGILLGDRCSSRSRSSRR